MVSNITPSERLSAFLQYLPTTRDEELVSPPGLGSVWRAGDIRNGLKRQILVVHHSGQGIAFAAFPSGHRAKDCRCVTCLWEYSASDPHSQPLSRERMMQLTAKLRRFRFAQTAEAGFE